MNMRLTSLCFFLLFNWQLGQAADEDIPDSLESWSGWVLSDESFRQCPFFSSAAGDGLKYVCAWPAALDIQVDANGGSFQQAWRVIDAGWVRLPGSADNWPFEVRVNGSKVPVTGSHYPRVWLEPGQATVRGDFHWQARPEELRVPTATGPVNLRVDGQSIRRPNVSDSKLWLGERSSDEEAERDEITLSVYRKITDGIPVALRTYINIRVGGEVREENLGRILPDGFVVVAINSALPGQINAAGELILQVRPGNFGFDISARALDDNITAIPVPDPLNGAEEEIWSFQADHAYRVLAIEGLDPIDPSQTGTPYSHELPAFIALAGKALQLQERGRSDLPPNSLILDRTLWLDFDLNGATMIDNVRGQMHDGWRVDMHPPYTLLQAKSHSDDLLVTRSAADSDDTGVELRRAQVQLATQARIENLTSSLPASGWRNDFQRTQINVMLPPGTRMLAALGADASYGEWLTRWSLFDMFIVLVVVAAVWRLLSPLYGGIVLLTALIYYQENPIFIFILFPLLVGVAMCKQLSEGKLLRLGQILRNASLAALVLVLLPLAGVQLRLVLHPQLEGYVSSLRAQQDQKARAKRSEVGEAEPELARKRAEVEGDGLTSVDDLMQDLPARKVPQTVATAALERVEVVGGRIAKRDLFTKYAADILVQAGQGKPDWSWRSVRLSWDGPLTESDTIRLVVLPQWMLRALRLVGIVGLALLLLGFAQMLRRPRFLDKPKFKSFRLPVVLLTLTLAAPLLPQDAVAAEFPPQHLLDELRNRLLEQPECVPDCATVESAEVITSDNALTINLDIHVAARSAVVLPGSRNGWEAVDITVNGNVRRWVYRGNKGRLRLDLSEGIHRVVLSGPLPDTATLQVPFPLRPREIITRGTGWEIAGTRRERLTANALELVRSRIEGDTSSSLQFDRAPTFVTVRRDFRLDLDFHLFTSVQRVAPIKGAFNLSIPLLQDETVIDESIKIEDDAVQASFGSETRSIQWSSELPRSNEINLQAAVTDQYRETWRFTASPTWHVEFSGMAQILPLPEEYFTGDYWTIEFRPRPGDQLTVKVTRPGAVPGETLAIDSVNVSEKIGKRARVSDLNFIYRSTQGGRHLVSFPEDASVEQLTIDGAGQPVQMEGNDIVIPLRPGRHHVKINWRANINSRNVVSGTSVNLNQGATNVRQSMEIARDRWILFVRGPMVGPAVLYWGELLVFLALALLLGRMNYTLLRTHDWVLLGLGLSTWSWSVFALVAFWLHVMAWRAKATLPEIRSNFNLMQLGLFVLSVTALVSLFSAVPATLLGFPDMHVAGNNSYGNALYWFSDRINGELPAITSVSVSIWAYKVVILLWSLWLAVNVLRWIRWAWQAFSEGGYWRGRIESQTTKVSSSEDAEF